MMDFPRVTVVHRRISKEAFYKNLTLNKSLKEKFVSDVEQINVENSFTKENLNLTVDSDVNEILLMSIMLKRKDFDGKVVEAIARQNPHKLVFLLQFEHLSQLALYHGKLYRTEWIDETETHLLLQGFSLEEIWNSFIEQIALHEEHAENTESLSVNERLGLQDQIMKLEKQIEKTEAAAWKEQQPKKQFDLYTRLQKYKQELEDLKHGNS